MDEQEFKTRADAALQSLYKKLTERIRRSTISSQISTPARLGSSLRSLKAKFVVSPNGPVRQIWVSAHSKSFKLDWDERKQAFVLPQTNETLDELIGSAIGQHLGESVRLI